MSEATLDLLIDRFWETVPPVWNQVRAYIRQTATQQFGLTVEQFHVLRYVRKGVESLSELAEAKRISRPAISQAVDMLVQKGLITRAQQRRDRRFLQLSLTEEGNAVLDGIFQTTRQWMRTQMAELSPSEIEAAMRGLDILKRPFAGKL